jgi:amino-acid N-acetyltransferase
VFGLCARRKKKYDSPTDNAPNSAAFVACFRSVAPYVNLFRGKTFVLAFGGKAIEGPLA